MIRIDLNFIAIVISHCPRPIKMLSQMASSKRYDDSISGLGRLTIAIVYVLGLTGLQTDATCGCHCGGEPGVSDPVRV